MRGVRASLDSAQNIKRHSDQVVDSVVAEDVGKLPDDNVAEALQRVTGIQITRSADEGQSVLIRGLPNVVTLLNGRDLFTTTGRYVALADVPAAFLRGVDVYKTNEADQIEGGIAGTIDVRLHRPFDFSGLEVSGTARDIYSTLSKSSDPNAAILVSDRWHTSIGEVGALFGLSYQERHYRNEIIDNYLSMPLVGNNNWVGAGPTPDVYFPNNIGQQLIQGDRKRPAANFALQWKVSDDLSLYTEGFYTEDHIRSDILFFVGLPNNSPGAPFGGISSYTLFPGTNEAKTITTQNAFSIASTQAFSSQDSQTYQFPPAAAPGSARKVEGHGRCGVDDFDLLEPQRHPRHQLFHAERLGRRQPQRLGHALSQLYRHRPDQSVELRPATAVRQLRPRPRSIEHGATGRELYAVHQLA